MDQEIRPLPGHKAQTVKNLILGTAGHIDHGKTALIKALTGVDTDRLPEEKKRGMTIELGFAGLDLDEVRFGVVDVPGHERFVRTMVAGATGIDVVLLVVAADDSVMPQTREHVDILRLLGVRHGVVAISKCDLVDAEMAQLVEEEVCELLAGSTMSDFPLIQVSSLTSKGLDRLKGALLEQARAVQDRQSSPVFRLAIDRVFTIHGRGTVVTGSAISGEVAVGDALELLPARRPCKVRGLQSHFDQADHLYGGQRVAVNLTGVDKEDIQRGDELATPDCLTPAMILDARILALTSNSKPLKHLQRVRLCIGTTECFVRLRFLKCDRLQPGQSAVAQLAAAAPVVAQWGQRYIIRDESDTRTLGGGSILRPVSRQLRKTDQADIEGLQVLLNGDELDRLEEVVRFDPGVTSSMPRLACVTGIAPTMLPAALEQLEAGGRLVPVGERRSRVASSMIDQCVDRAMAYLRNYHDKHRDEPGCALDKFTGMLKRRHGEDLGAHVFELLTKDQVRLLGRFCCLTEFAPKMSADDHRLLDEIVGECKDAGFQPPAPNDLKCAAGAQKNRLNKLIKIAIAGGDLIPIAPNILLHRERVEELKRLLVEHVAASGPFTVADVRNMTSSSRKFVVPILEYLDKSGFTRRSGDHRSIRD